MVSVCLPQWSLKSYYHDKVWLMLTQNGRTMFKVYSLYQVFIVHGLNYKHRFVVDSLAYLKR